MQSADEAYAAALWVALAFGAVLWLVAGLFATLNHLGHFSHRHTMRRLRGTGPRSLRDTQSMLGTDSDSFSRRAIRSDIAEYGAWDSSRGVYVVRLPVERTTEGDDGIRCYAWTKPHYVLDSVMWSPLSVAVAAVLVYLMLGSYMAGGLHYGFPPGGLAQALEDKYGAHVAVSLPQEPALNQVFEGVFVTQYDSDDSASTYPDCTVNAAGGIETLTVLCPDQSGYLRELHQRLDMPRRWF